MNIGYAINKVFEIFLLSISKLFSLILNHAPAVNRKIAAILKPGI